MACIQNCLRHGGYNLSVLHSTAVKIYIYSFTGRFYPRQLPAHVRYTVCLLICAANKFNCLCVVSSIGQHTLFQQTKKDDSRKMKIQSYTNCVSDTKDHNIEIESESGQKGVKRKQNLVPFVPFAKDCYVMITLRVDFVDFALMSHVTAQDVMSLV